jgi:hypothetical protein
MRQALVGQSDSHHQIVTVTHCPGSHPQSLEGSQHRVVLGLNHAHDPIGAESPRIVHDLAK